MAARRLVATMPDARSAVSNCVYVSQDDAELAPETYVMIGHFVWTPCTHPQVQAGFVALNSGQRQCLGVKPMDTVQTSPYTGAAILEKIDTIFYELIDKDNTPLPAHDAIATYYSDHDDDMEALLNETLSEDVVTENQVVVLQHQHQNTNYRIRVKTIKNQAQQEIYRGIIREADAAFRRLR